MNRKILILALCLIAGLSYASEIFIEWKPGSIQLDEDGHYRGPRLRPYKTEPQTHTVDHTEFGVSRPDCQKCHNNPELGYDYVSTEKFSKTKHYQMMTLKGHVNNIQDACIVCHVDKDNQFIPYPGDNLKIPEPFRIYDVENDNSSTCGKCHTNITSRNKDHIMSTAKGHYYRSEIFPYQEALVISAEKVYNICSGCHTSCASSCHMIYNDGKAIDWTFIQPFLDKRVGPSGDYVKIKLAEGVEMEAVQIKEYLIGHYLKGGGPGYRMLAKMGKAPLETIKIDIASHELVVPDNLPNEAANDICLRCHTCMIDPQDRLEPNLAHKSLKCVDCHRDGDVHGHRVNYARFSYEAVDASCRTCHLKEDIYKGKAATSDRDRKVPIVNSYIYEAAPHIPPVEGAHKNVSCEVCHSAGMKQCNECHLGDLQNTVGDILELGKEPVFYGKDKDGIVRLMLIHEIFGRDGNKYGGWIMKHTVHTLKKNTNTDCEGCHTEPVRMGIIIPKLSLVNTYLLNQAGVVNAYIKKDEHYKKVSASGSEVCIDCHTEAGAALSEQYHRAKKFLN